MWPGAQRARSRAGRAGFPPMPAYPYFPGGRRLSQVKPARTRRGDVRQATIRPQPNRDRRIMYYTIATADRTTHLKTVVVALPWMALALVLQ